MKKLGIVIASLVFVFAMVSIQPGNAGKTSVTSSYGISLQTEQDTNKVEKKKCPADCAKKCCAAKDKKACPADCAKKCCASKKKSSCGHKH